ncbi:MAG: hypothetical protein U0N82_08355 [Oscillospiraceae bacterium]
MKLDLKTMLKATLGGVLLTLGLYFCIRPLPVRINYLREFELIAVWIILLIGWITYFFLLWKNKKQ